VNNKIDQRLKLTLRQLEVFVAVARGGSPRAGADEISRSQSAASNALKELEGAVGVELFDRVGRRLIINENGRALLPQLIATWKEAHPESRVLLRIANTHDVFEAVAAFAADIGFIEGSSTHPDLRVRRWRTDQLVVVSAPGHPVAGKRLSAKQLQKATWVLREPGSGTREASDRWLIPQLAEMQVELELGSNEAVKRAVAAGIGLGCLSRLAVEDALSQGWLAEVFTTFPDLTRTLSIVLHRSKKLGTTAEAFLVHSAGV